MSSKSVSYVDRSTDRKQVDQERIEEVPSNSAELQRMREAPGDPDDPRSLAEKTACLDAALRQVEHLQESGMLLEEVQEALPAIRERHALSWLRLEERGSGTFAAEGKVNPHGTGADVVMLTDADVDFINGCLMGVGGAGVGDDRVALQLRFARALDQPLVRWADGVLRDWCAYEVSRDARTPDATFCPDAEPALSAAVRARLGGGLEAIALAWMPARRSAGNAPDLQVGPQASAVSGASDDAPQRGAVREVALQHSGRRDYAAAVEAIKERRTLRSSWSHEDLDTMRETLTQLETARRLYVADTEEPPEGAYLDAMPGRVSIVRTSELPVPATRGQAWPESMEYSDGDYTYRVRLWNLGKSAVPTLATPPFEVERTPARAAKTARGRAFVGDQGFFVNPAFKGTVEDSMAPTVGGRVRQFQSAEEAEAEGFLPQAARDDEPFVFCVPEAFGRAGGRPDPKHEDNPGMARRAPDGGFAEAARDRPLKEARVYQTHRPAISRSDGKRNPQRAAGGKPAHAFMGSGQPGGGKADVPAFAGSRALGSHEYCHLVGDGDAGVCDARNLVVGTTAVNTEQLAMEETLRPYRSALRRLGFGVQLTVSAIVDDTPVQFVDADGNDEALWPASSMATFIEYRIEASPEDTGLPFEEALPVHRQVMDGQRGVITAMEVEVLKKTVASKFDALLAELQGVDAKLSGKTRHALDAASYQSRPGARSGSPASAQADQAAPPAAPQQAVLNGRGLSRVDQPQAQPPGTEVGRFAQGDYVGGATACPGTAVRAAERLLAHGFDGLDVEATVRQGVTDYNAVRAAHPGAPAYLANYEMRTSDQVDYALGYDRGFTIRHGDYSELAAELDEDGTAVALTAGEYNFTVAQVHGVFGLFDSHTNTLHERAYAERFGTLGALMRGIKTVIARHDVDPHSDVSAEVYHAPAAAPANADVVMGGM